MWIFKKKKKKKKKVELISNADLQTRDFAVCEVLKVWIELKLGGVGKE
jgi:hypothetical protein